MLSEDYIKNIFNRSNTELTTNGESYVLTTTLPNCFTISVADETIERCVDLTKSKIRELETYLEKDRTFYGYDLDNEYSEEN